MNHKKAIPANGSRFKARLTLLELDESQTPSSWGLYGTEIQMSTRLIIIRIENMIPATAAARGVVNLLFGKLAFGFIAFSLYGSARFGKRYSRSGFPPAKG
jgi:hypothetical protein